MRLTCWYCHKPVSTELSKDAIFRAIAVCPECIEASPEADNLLIDAPAPANPADGEDEPKIDPADCLKGFGDGPHYGGLKRRSEP